MNYRIRKKHTSIEAIQYRGNNLEELKTFLPDDYFFITNNQLKLYILEYMCPCAKIKTKIVREFIVKKGNYLLKTALGTYLLNAKDFHKIFIEGR